MNMTALPPRRARGLIIGFGNPWFGDDGAGPAVVERMSSMVQDDQVELRVLHQLVPECADMFASVRRVILIDAEVGVPAGAIRVRRVGLRPESSASLRGSTASGEPFGHRWTPGSILRLASVLHGHIPRVRLVTIGIGSLETSDQLSPPVQAAVERLAKSLARFGRSLPSLCTS